QSHQWSLNTGAEVVAGGVRFRVWAPKCKRLEVMIEGQSGPGISLTPEARGFFSRIIPQIQAGALYYYRLDGNQQCPHPCSRFHPRGPHGPSQVVDPRSYRWRDTNWTGVQLPGQVLYEMHVGTFTPEGTFEAATRELAELKRIGITL